MVAGSLILGTIFLYIKEFNGDSSCVHKHTPSRISLIKKTLLHFNLVLIISLLDSYELTKSQEFNTVCIQRILIYSSSCKTPEHFPNANKPRLRGKNIYEDTQGPTRCRTILSFPVTTDQALSSPKTTYKKRHFQRSTCCSENTTYPKETLQILFWIFHSTSETFFICNPKH